MAGPEQLTPNSYLRDSLTMDAVVALLPPAWVLALVLAALNVVVFRVILGREGHSAFYYLPFGIFGFGAGNLLAWLAASPLPPLGDIHVIEASLGAWLALGLTNLWRS